MLLQTEADFYQTEDLMPAVECHKRVVDEEQERDKVHILHYNTSWNTFNKDLKLFKKSKDTGFKFVAHQSNLYSKNNIRGYLQGDCWVRKEHKSFQYCLAHALLLLRGRDLRIFDERRYYTNVDMDIWIRNCTVDFQIFL